MDNKKDRKIDVTAILFLLARRVTSNYNNSLFFAVQPSGPVIMLNFIPFFVFCFFFKYFFFGGCIVSTVDVFYRRMYFE